MWVMFLFDFVNLVEGKGMSALLDADIERGTSVDPAQWQPYHYPAALLLFSLIHRTDLGNDCSVLHQTDTVGQYDAPLCGIEESEFKDFAFGLADMHHELVAGIHEPVGMVI